MRPAIGQVILRRLYLVKVNWGLNMPHESALQVSCIRETVLGVDVVRGFARLCDLAAMSRADVYDAKFNPTGTQRDLSPKHARDAYLYVRQEERAYWPEIFLCARSMKFVQFKSAAENEGRGVLTVDLAGISKAGSIEISRVDGNHRLHFASGEFEGYPAVEKLVSFSLALGLTLEEEMKIFRDINNNQRRMNTSHLAHMNVRLTGEDSLKFRDPKLYLANKLSETSGSPFFKMVYDGGKKDVTKIIPLKSLQSGLEYMFSQPSRLSAIDDVDMQYTVISNYFMALKKWEPECWHDPKSFLMLRGAGFWGVCFLGAEIIDRGLKKGHYKADDLLKILYSGRKWDWRNKGDFAGFSGRGGAIKIRDKIVSEIADDESVSLRNLMKQISDDL
jgi:DGQHR domain-containing protein